eukprot:Tbor_TRINITY_DN3181_c0_g1::TRINITY_DN3181_c0_g1_i1::g.14617::m.14617
MTEHYFCYACNMLIEESPLRESNDIKCVKCMSSCVEIIESNEQMRDILESPPTDPQNMTPRNEAPAPSINRVTTVSTVRPIGGQNLPLILRTPQFAQMLSMMNLPGVTVSPSSDTSAPRDTVASTSDNVRGAFIPQGGSVTVTVRIRNADGSDYEVTEAVAANSVGETLADRVNETVRNISSANRGDVVVERRRGANYQSPAQRSVTVEGARRRNNNTHTDPTTTIIPHPLFQFQGSPFASAQPVLSQVSPFRFRYPRRRTEADGAAPGQSLHSHFQNLFQIILDMGNDREMSSSERMHGNYENSRGSEGSTGSLYSDDDDDSSTGIQVVRGTIGNMPGSGLRFMVRQGFENPESIGESINDFLHRIFQSQEVPTNPTPPDVIRSLPTIAGGVTKAMKEANNMYAQPCSVCQDEFDERSEPVVQLTCGHVYHRDCIVPWLERSQQCPTCRGNVVTGQSPR